LAESSNEHASMTPSVKGNKDKYVDGEYGTLNINRYARTVNNGDRA
jgi:hypothetical protein